jgi:hypothetical protein
LAITQEVVIDKISVFCQEHAKQFMSEKVKNYLGCLKVYNNILNLSKGRPAIQSHEEDWDKDIYLLNTPGPSLTVPPKRSWYFSLLQARGRVLAPRRRGRGEISGGRAHRIRLADVRRQRHPDRLEDFARHAGHRRA